MNFATFEPSELRLPFIQSLSQFRSKHRASVNTYTYSLKLARICVFDKQLLSLNFVTFRTAYKNERPLKLLLYRSYKHSLPSYLTIVRFIRAIFQLILLLTMKPELVLLQSILI